MGIKNLSVIIKRYAPESITYTTIKYYENKIIGIDANLLLYKLIYAIRKNGYDIKNDNKNITHIHTLLSKLIAFIKYNITPVFIFDGMAPAIKSGTLEKRKEFQQHMQKKYSKATSADEKKKYYFMKSEISQEEINDCKKLIRIFGYTIIDAIEEADSQLADLVSNKIVDYAATDDMDILVFGGANILKNFSVDKRKTIEEINLAKFLKTTGLTQSQLIDLAILLGCDYCSTIYGIGTIGGYIQLKKYGSVEKIAAAEGKKVPKNYYETKKYFTNPLVLPHTDIKIKRLNLDVDALVKFLKEMNYPSDSIKKILDKINQKN